MLLKLLVTLLLHIVFLTDQMKHKAVNKTTCRTPSGNPGHLCAHYLENFSTFSTLSDLFKHF